MEIGVQNPQMAHVGIPLEHLLVAMVVPEIYNRPCPQEVSSFRPPVLGLAPSVPPPASLTPCVLPCQSRRGFSHPLASPSSSSQTFVIVPSAPSLALPPKRSFLLCPQDS